METSFEFNRQNQKDNEQEMQIENNCVTTIKRLELFHGQKKKKKLFDLMTESSLSHMTPKNHMFNFPQSKPRGRFQGFIVYDFENIRIMLKKSSWEGGWQR